MNIEVCRRFVVEAAHQVKGAERCSRMHGHTYHITICYQGTVNEKGMVVDFKAIDDIVRDIIRDLDHSYLNTILGDYATAEELIIYLKRKLPDYITPAKLSRIRVQETPTNFAEWRCKD